MELVKTATEVCYLTKLEILPLFHNHQGNKEQYTH